MPRIIYILLLALHALTTPDAFIVSRNSAFDYGWSTRTQRCESGQFTCQSNGDCIPEYYQCDEHYDCLDGSDEWNCSPTGCESGKFRCQSNGECIPEHWQCDEEWDCLDGSDERYCPSAIIPRPTVRFTPGCGNGQFQCRFVRDCIPKRWQCDGWTDCRDSSDELYCAPTSTPRPTTRLTQAPASCPHTSNEQPPTCGHRPLDRLNHQTGRRKRNVRTGRPLIFGGLISPEGHIPWQARIMKTGVGRSSHGCGGTIINEYWILTAAHCVLNTPSYAVRVRVGDYGAEPDRCEQEFDVSRVFIHEQFNGIRPVDHPARDMHHDIALLQIQPVDGHGIVFSDYVQPACLPDEELHSTDQILCTVSGWGLTEYNGSLPDDLLYTDVQIFLADACMDSWGPLDETQLCAGKLESWYGPCNGDSGGGLVCSINGQYKAIGIVSFGAQCGTTGVPQLYTNVHSLLPWILDTINN